MSFLTIIHEQLFWISAGGAAILAIAAAMVGTLSVLKGQSLIGDAIGHSSFPGVIIAFMLFQTRDPLVLMAGASVSGIIAYILINISEKNSKTSLDSALAAVLSSMFGLGLVLHSYIQDNSKYSEVSQSGLANYIFGQAAFMSKRDFKMILAVALICIALLFIFHKEIKLFVFDSVQAQLAGFGSKRIGGLILLMTMAIIATGLKIVGAILISAMLIAPAVTALQWTDKYEKVLALAAASAAISALAGSYISTAFEGFAMGATIIVVMSLVALISLLISPKGIIKTAMAKRKYRKELAESISEKGGLK